MSKKFTRVIALFLFSAMLVASFTGCSKTKEDSSKGATTSVEKNDTIKGNASKAKNEEPVEIKIVVTTPPGPDEDAPVIKKIEEKYNVKFNWEWVIDGGKFNEVMGVKLSAGEMPDFILLPDSGNIHKYIKQGLAAPITDEMKAKIPTYFDVVEKYDVDNNMWVDAMYKGQLYGLKPISSQGAYPTILVWRTDWLKAMGMDGIPKTLDEFETAMYKFANENPNKSGQKDTYGFSETTFNAVFGAFGAVPMKTLSGKGRQVLYMTKDQDGNVAFACTRPEMKDALAKLQQYYKDGIIDPEFITGENKGGYWATSHAFVNGKVGVTGMVIATHWNPPLTPSQTKGGAVYNEMIAANPDAKFGDTFDLSNGFTGPNGKVGTHKWGAVNSNLAVFTTQCVKDERKVNALLELIEDNFSDYEQHLLVTQGIEGEHYTVTEDGEIVNNTEKYPKAADRRKQGIYVLELLQQPDFRQKKIPWYYEFMDKYNGPGYADERYPKTEAYTKHISSLERLAVETYLAIITGEKNIDEFDQFVKDFYKNGGEEIEKEINTQIAENLGLN